MMRSQLCGSLRLSGDSASSSRYSLEYFPVFPATRAVAQTCNLQTNQNFQYGAGAPYSQMLPKSHKNCLQYNFLHPHHKQNDTSQHYTDHINKIHYTAFTSSFLCIAVHSEHIVFIQGTVSQQRSLLLKHAMDPNSRQSQI